MAENEIISPMRGMPRATAATALDPRKCPDMIGSTIKVMDCTRVNTRQDGRTFLTVLAVNTLDCNSVFKIISSLPLVIAHTRISDMSGYNTINAKNASTGSALPDL